MLLNAGNLIRTNAVRNAGTLHRNAITVVDKLAVPTVSAASAVTESGSTLANVAYKYTAVAGNRYGSTTAAGALTITPTANQAVRIPIAIVTGAEWYDIFLSVDTNPLWVGRITESQRSTGGFIISTVGTVTVNPNVVTGTIDIGIPGTGVAATAVPFSTNNAYNFSGISAVNCAGYTTAVIYVRMTVDDLRSAPTGILLLWQQDQTTGDWHAFQTITLALLGALRQPLLTTATMPVNGGQFVALIDVITGQNAAISVWVDLF